MRFIGIWLVVMSAAILNEAPGSIALQGSYLIRSRKVTEAPEALAMLRRFVPGESSSEERCEKYAVLLNMMRSEIVDQFNIAELGLASRDHVKSKINSLDVGTLRQLYIDGINQLSSGDLDPSLLELVDCLNAKFRSIDAKARSFLNNRDLQDTVSQYKSILNQPLEFLLNPNARHSTLTNGELKPAVRDTMIRIFNGDRSQVDSRFAPITFIPPPPQLPRKFAQATVAYPEGGDVNLPPAVERQPHVGPIEGDASLDDEERAYLSNLAVAFGHIYQTMLLDTKLNDRCQTYAQVFLMSKESLNEAEVEGLIREGLARRSKSDTEEVAFVPEQRVRENFLFALSTFGPLDLGVEPWIDLVDCLSQWDQVDPEVRKFMHSQELADIFQHILTHADEAAKAQADKAPSSEVAK